MRAAGTKAKVAHMIVVDVVGFSKLSQSKQVRVDNQLREIARTTEPYRRACEHHAVVPIDTGDGFVLAFFDDVEGPVCTALEVMDRALDAGIRLRIGLHTGPVTLITDLAGKENIKGVGVNVAVRVLDCTGTLGICMTEHYASLLRRKPAWRYRLVGRGIYRVKHGLCLRINELIHDHTPASTTTHQLPEKSIEHFDRSSAFIAIGASTLALGIGVFAAEVKNASTSAAYEQKLREHEMRLNFIDAIQHNERTGTRIREKAFP